MAYALGHSLLPLCLNSSEEPIPTKGNGSPQKGQFRKLSLSAGLTDHRGTLQELS
jgi:hypothetical protein